MRSVGPHTVLYVVRTGEDRAARFGFIVSKQVGTAVTRNTVRRRLKAISAAALPDVRRGSDVVIRALPAAAGVEFDHLQAEVLKGLRRRAA